MVWVAKLSPNSLLGLNVADLRAAIWMGSPVLRISALPSRFVLHYEAPKTAEINTLSGPERFPDLPEQRFDNGFDLLLGAVRCIRDCVDELLFGHSSSV